MHASTIQYSFRTHYIVNFLHRCSFSLTFFRVNVEYQLLRISKRHTTGTKCWSMLQTFDVKRSKCLIVAMCLVKYIFPQRIFILEDENDV